MKFPNDMPLGSRAMLVLFLFISWFSAIPQTTAAAKSVETGKDHPKYGPALDVDKILGISGGKKILNGEKAVIGDYPWFTMIAVRINGSLYLGGCGSSLIASRWVLTAAHCISDEFVNDGLVLVGALKPFVLGNGGQYSEFIEVENIYIHPDFKANDFFADYDFALLELTKDSTVTPVGFDRTGVSEEYSTGYGNLHAAGFGVTAPGGSMSNELLEVNLQYVSNDDCTGGPKDPYQWSQEYITDAMMCAADNDLSNSLVEAPCQGDSGGPLYDAANNIVVGVVSWGDGTDTGGALCSDIPELPTVFARVSIAAAWMQQVMGLAPTPTSPTPSAPTPTSTECQDSSLRFKVDFNGRKITRDCTWVENKATAQRCKIGSIAEMCSKTCDNCDTCADSSSRFKVIWNNKKVSRDCTWVGNRATTQKCNLDGIKEACCSTCQ